MTKSSKSSDHKVSKRESKGKKDKSKSKDKKSKSSNKAKVSELMQYAESLSKPIREAFSSMNHMNIKSAKNVLIWEDRLFSTMDKYPKLFKLWASDAYINGEKYHFEKEKKWHYKSRKEQKVIIEEMERLVTDTISQKIDRKDIEDVTVGKLMNFIKVFRSPDLGLAISERMKYIADSYYEKPETPGSYVRKVINIKHHCRNSIDQFINALPDSTEHCITMTYGYQNERDGCGSIAQSIYLKEYHRYKKELMEHGKVGEIKLQNLEEVFHEILSHPDYGVKASQQRNTRQHAIPYANRNNGQQTSGYKPTLQIAGGQNNGGQYYGGQYNGGQHNGGQYNGGQYNNSNQGGLKTAGTNK
ncbi:uncharacterized protein KGF55_004429 [Candida pseudojiufengensis]|uniref:uncharacterized protein n=1 Tax=Candida pseudojiufengensis TaxID=497109 RepID=UPI002225935D|nr:uncharacterized protein KGF55_004429 [Candida pseudojiufengensis]KAI5960859.1 hypothetical protein KGF55_004429 [Candida pseudojiufengensis]